ncbi:hypothetical protein DYE49_07280 [Treponema rectale]|uniref:Uncharacterized protein n=1 Tax=Treponema rectale TaxID=744512 RepID=A0A840S666_9SPIR|nr:hypothetical protein [Treponema rectale]MBB5218019.1 hypothetical protein [Treponema rectale]QOS40266.1 hypothetical protein DYE49_07280 [Treponema rectale]
MKTNDWFAVFPFGKTDVLIPHDSVADFSCSDISSPPGQIPGYCIDEIFSETPPSPDSQKRNSILIRQKKTFFITSMSNPEIQHEEIKNFHFPPKLLRDFFYKKGIAALGFDKEKLKILIDPEKITAEAVQ